MIIRLPSGKVSANWRHHSPLASRLALVSLAMCLSLTACRTRAFNSQASAEKPRRHAPMARPEAPVYSPSELLSFVERGYVGLNWNWIVEGPYVPDEGNQASPGFVPGTHRTEGFVRSLLALGVNPSESANYARIRAAILARKPPGRPDSNLARMDLAARLTVYDEPTWLSFVRAFSREGRRDAALKDSLVPVLEAMPDALRARLYDELGSADVRARLSDPMEAFRTPGLYEWAILNKKGIPRGCEVRRDGHCEKTAPKRSIDAFLRNTSRVESFFGRMLGEGATGADVVKAYDTFLLLTRTRVFRGSLAGQYTGQDIVSILSYLRRGLNQARAWPSISWDDYFSGRSQGVKPAFILAMGSMVNGRGIFLRNPDLLTRYTRGDAEEVNNESLSDFDMYVRPISKLYEPLLALVPGAYANLVSDLTRAHRADSDLKPRFQMEKYEEVQELNSATLSPLFFRIEKDGLYLLVYKTSRFSDNPHESVDGRGRPMAAPFVPAKRLPPKCYAIEGTCPPEGEL